MDQSKELAERYKERLKNRLSKKRYEHSLGVANMAARLAGINHVDIEKAYMAGLLHDYAKELSETELYLIAKEQNLLQDHVDCLQPDLLHGAVGAYLLRQEGIPLDEEMAEAITYHTTGHPNMSDLAKIIYISDYIEPGRSFPGVDQLRVVAHTNLDAGVLAGLNSTLVHVLQKGGYIHPLSISTRNVLLEQFQQDRS